MSDQDMSTSEKQPVIEQHLTERPSVPQSRPRFWAWSSIAIACLYGLFLIYSKASPPSDLLSQHPLIDGHNDLLMLLRSVYPDIYNQNFTSGFEDGGLLGHVDIPRIKKGKMGGAFWSAFVPCPEDGFDFSDANYAPYVKMTLEQIDLFNRLADRYPSLFTLAATAAEAERAWPKKLISPLAIEGLHQIGNSLATLRLYHQLGVRYATLTWNCHNRYADAAVVAIDGKFVKAKPYWNGVSQEGQKAIFEMNRLGMLVDLSHTSVDTMKAALGGGDWKGSIAPPIFSHSSAYAICPHPRNVPDDVLQLVKKRNSLVMVNFSPDFVSCKASNSSDGMPEFVEENSTLDQVVKHIKHIGELIGYDHVGIGTDYDGIPTTPRGLDDVSKFPALVKELRKTVSDADIAKILGRNLLRVWHEADAVAKSLKHNHPALN